MASPDVMPRKLWEHPDPDSTNMARFMRDVNKKRGLKLKVSFVRKKKSRTQSLSIFNPKHLVYQKSTKRFIDQYQNLDIPRSLQILHRPSHRLLV
jgi:acetoacetyl-CoA synthetase